jgi:hypothetical protein
VIEAREATVADLLTLLRVGPMVPRATARVLMLQFARSESIALELDERLQAVVGFYPLGSADAVRWFELWLMIRPAPPAAVLLRLRSLARLTLARLAQDQPVGIRAHVAQGHVPGRRMAQLVGLAFAGDDGRSERWEWRGG